MKVLGTCVICWTGLASWLPREVVHEISRAKHISSGQICVLLLDSSTPALGYQEPVSVVSEFFWQISSVAIASRVSTARANFVPDLPNVILVLRNRTGATGTSNIVLPGGNKWVPSFPGSTFASAVNLALVTAGVRLIRRYLTIVVASSCWVNLVSRRPSCSMPR